MEEGWNRGAAAAEEKDRRRARLDVEAMTAATEDVDADAAESIVMAIRMMLTRLSLYVLGC